MLAAHPHARGVHKCQYVRMYQCNGLSGVGADAMTLRTGVAQAGFKLKVA